MKYILINDIQRILKEIHMPQHDIIFHVSIWYVTNNIKFDLYLFIKVFGYRTWIFSIWTWIFSMIYIKSHLMNWK